jgi:hypothetical protein
MAVGWSVVRAWAEFNHLTRLEFEMLDRLVQAMDHEYIAWWADKHPPDPPSTSPRRLR